MVAHRRKDAVEIVVEHADHGTRAEVVGHQREIAQIDQHQRRRNRADVAAPHLAVEDQLARLVADIGAQQALDKAYQRLALGHDGIMRQQRIEQRQLVVGEAARPPRRPGERVDRPGGIDQRRDHVMDIALLAQLFEQAERQRPAGIEPPFEPAVAFDRRPAPGFPDRSRSFRRRDRGSAHRSARPVSTPGRRRDSAGAARADAATRGRAACRRRPGARTIRRTARRCRAGNGPRAAASPPARGPSRRASCACVCWHHGRPALNGGDVMPDGENGAKL